MPLTHLQSNRICALLFSNCIFLNFPFSGFLPMKVDVKKERRSIEEWEKTTVRTISSYKLLSPK